MRLGGLPDHGVKQYCSACFDGDYPTRVPSNKQKNRFEYKISQNGRKKK